MAESLRFTKPAINAIQPTDKRVFYRDADGAVATISRSNFQLMVDARTVSSGTIVFDTMLTTVGDLRAGRFETTFAACWHAKLFRRRSLTDGASTE